MINLRSIAHLAATIAATDRSNASLGRPPVDRAGLFSSMKARGEIARPARVPGRAAALAWESGDDLAFDGPAPRE